MDVHHAIDVIFGDAHLFQESAQDDQIHSGLSAAVEDDTAETLHRIELIPLDDNTRDFRRRRKLYPARARAAGDDELDLDVELTGVDLPDQVPQGSASARDQHGNAQRRR